MFTSTAHTQYVDVDKLFHANPPSLTSRVSSEADNEISDFKIFRGPRHDEFDWALTKVGKISLK